MAGAYRSLLRQSKHLLLSEASKKIFPHMPLCFLRSILLCVSDEKYINVSILDETPQGLSSEGKRLELASPKLFE